MAETYQSGGDSSFSWRRVTAFASAFALHAFAFAMMMAPVAPPPPKDKAIDRKVTVRFGEAMEFSRYEGMDRDRYVLRAVTDSVMAEVMRLSGQEYVDMYASKAKEAA